MPQAICMEGEETWCALGLRVDGVYGAGGRIYWPDYLCVKHVGVGASTHPCQWLDEEWRRDRGSGSGRSGRGRGG